MSYITAADLSIPDATLVDLTDDANVGEIDGAIITAAIADAEALIHSYCSPRYEVPFDTAPDVVKRLIRAVTKQALYERRDHVPEAVQAAYKEALKQLRDIADGRLSLGLDTAPDAGSQAEGARFDKTSEDRVFTSTTLEGF